MRLEFQVNIRLGHFLPEAKLSGISDFLTDRGPITFTHLTSLCPAPSSSFSHSSSTGSSWIITGIRARNNLHRNLRSLFIILDGYSGMEQRHVGTIDSSLQSLILIYTVTSFRLKIFCWLSGESWSMLGVSRTRRSAPGRPMEIDRSCSRTIHSSALAIWWLHEVVIGQEDGRIVFRRIL